MKLLDLPVELLVKILHYLDVSDLCELLNYVPSNFSQLIVYVKYSKPIIITSNVCPFDIDYIADHQLVIHPQRLLIDNYHEKFITQILPNILKTSCKIAISIKDETIMDLIDILVENQPLIDIYLLSNFSQLDISRLNVRYLKFLTTRSLITLPPTLKHIDLSFTGLTDLKLANITFPTTIETIDLSHNTLGIVNNHNFNIQGLVNLKTLNLSNNDITYFNVVLSNCINLTSLDLSSNLLVDASFIDHCRVYQRLQFFGLSRNIIRWVPRCINIERTDLIGCSEVELV